MEEQQMRRLAKKLTGEEMTNADVDEMVNKVAGSIRAFALDMRRGMYDDGKMYLAVVNTVRALGYGEKRLVCLRFLHSAAVVLPLTGFQSHDALTSFANNYKPWEIVFLRKAIEEIVDTYAGSALEGSCEGALEESDLFNLRENTTISEVSELIRKLTAEKWLAPSAVVLQTASLTLGPRAYLELIAFLRDLQVKKCPICTYELLQGVKCQESRCETVVHVSCIDKYESKDLSYKCPTCKKPVRRQ
ncbi:hypothetical protein BBJ28_00011002 [Nothophytophthora sp. Chile5]|nr:hypothetical protein BBJ28_00011002 [Nothophytophthora sp. Chile5]